MPCTVCGGNAVEAQGLAPLLLHATNKQLDTEAARVAREIYSGKFVGLVDRKMTLLVAGHLADGMMKGTGRNWMEVDYGTPDYKMMRNLEKNIYQFSSAKNHSQLQRMTKALKDGNGNIRPFADFKKEAVKINKVYSHVHLKTEYNTAVNGSNAAARWQECQEDKDVMPYLRYETAGDKRVRGDHAELNNVVRHIDDNFWDQYYPPNGFNCRCTTAQQMHGPITNDIAYPDVTPMFRVNTGKQQIAFPKGHPYFKGAPKKVMAEAERLLMHNARKQSFGDARISLIGKTVAHPEISGKIGFTSKGLKKIINQPHKHYVDKIRVLPKIDDVLKKAVYLFPGKYTGIEFNIKQFHYFEFMLSGDKSYIVVKELKDGTLSVYSITDNIKK